MIRPSHLTGIFGALILMLCTRATQAGSATWDLNPGSGDWNTPANWTPISVPNGSADTATFALSNTTNVSISANITVNGIIFTTAATNPYTITASPGLTLTLSGVGITNNSGIAQNFVTTPNGIRTAISFINSATAGNATFTNKSATASFVSGGAIFFSDNATAANGTFTNSGAAISRAGPGSIDFFETSTAGDATIINNGATGSGAVGGGTLFGDFGVGTTCTAGNATIINNGGTGSGAGGGETIFFARAFNGLPAPTATAGNATLIANGGTAGGQGGTIEFGAHSTGGTSRVEVFGNGNLDVSFHSVTIGSIEGDGNAFLGAKNLTVGSNNMDTTFSGVIQDGGLNGGTGGSLTKIGSGTLTLLGINTYSGNTDVNGGVLKVDGSITSNTFVHGRGTLAGTGMVNGAVPNNGRVSPGDAPGILTVASYAQGSNGHLLIDIAGASNGQFSVLDVLGNANLNGLLDPIFQNGFIPTIGESFVFLNSASLTGEFSKIDEEILNHQRLEWSVTYNQTFAALTFQGARNVPDGSSTLLLLVLGLLGLVTYRQQLLRQLGAARVIIRNTRRQAQCR